MIRFRKASKIPFTASQFRIGEPNAISFSIGARALTLKLIMALSKFLLARSNLDESSRDQETDSLMDEMVSAVRCCSKITAK